MKNKTIYIVRKGHLGDVILTEPIARTLKAAGHTVVLVTEYTHVGPVLPTYDHVKPYSFFLRNRKAAEAGFFVTLAHELYPQLHYIDAFARCAEVSILDRYPRVLGGHPPMVQGTYCLIAPHEFLVPQNERVGLSKVPHSRIAYRGRIRDHDRYPTTKAFVR